MHSLLGAKWRCGSCKRMSSSPILLRSRISMITLKVAAADDITLEADTSGNKIEIRFV